MKIPMVAAAVFGLVQCSVSVLAAESLDGVAAVVNKEVITFAQVREVTSDDEARARRELVGEPLKAKLKEIRMKALNKLIERKRSKQPVRTTN